MQKDIFDYNFRTKALSMTIVLTYDLTFQGHGLCEITFWASYYSQLFNGQIVTQESLGRGLQ